jgi:hypothetical protein
MSRRRTIQEEQDIDDLCEQVGVGGFLDDIEADEDGLEQELEEEE